MELYRNAGDGIIAGAAGTVALNFSTYFDMRSRGAASN